jgi:hypothetical protein
MIRVRLFWRDVGSPGLLVIREHRVGSEPCFRRRKDAAEALRFRKRAQAPQDCPDATVSVSTTQLLVSASKPSVCRALVTFSLGVPEVPPEEPHPNDSASGELCARRARPLATNSADARARGRVRANFLWCGSHEHPRWVYSQR